MSETPTKPVKAPETAPALQRGFVNARITKMGHGLVSTGEHTIETGYTFYNKDEIIPFPMDVAQALEARGYAEIQD